MRIDPKFGLESNKIPEPVRFKKQKKKKKFKIKFACCGLVVFLFLSFFLTSAAIVAKTGAFEIPILSAVFYKFPEPVRIVKLDGDEEINDFSATADLNSQSGLLSFEITEQQLTSFLKAALASSGDGRFAANIQGAITNDGLEIFGLLLKPLRCNVILNIWPHVQDSRIELDIESAKIGDLSLPPFLLTLVVDTVLKDIKHQLYNMTDNFGEIQDLELLAGKIIINKKLNIN